MTSPVREVLAQLGPAIEAEIAAMRALGAGEPRLAYSAREAAEVLSVSRRHIYELIEQGELRSVNLGERMVRITRDELEAFIARREAERDRVTPMRRKRGA